MCSRKTLFTLTLLLAAAMIMAATSGSVKASQNTIVVCPAIYDPSTFSWRGLHHASPNWIPWTSAASPDAEVTIVIERFYVSPVERAIYEGKLTPSGNITITVPWDWWTVADREGFNITVYWNFTAYDGTKMSFLVNSSTANSITFYWDRSNTRLVDDTSSPRVTINMTDNSLLKQMIYCAIVNMTVRAMDSMDPPYGPNPLGGSRIIIYNGTNWTRKTWGDGSTPAVLYNVTTPESGTLAGQYSFLLPNTTDVTKKPEALPYNNYTVGINIYWNDLLVYNMTLHQNSNSSAWRNAHAAWWYPAPYNSYTPYNFTFLATKTPRWLNCSVYAYEMILLDLNHPGNPLASVPNYLEIEVSMTASNSTIGTVLAARPRTTDQHGRVVLRYAAPCVDGEEGNIALGIGHINTDLIVYWKSMTLGVQYLILNETLNNANWRYGGDVMPFGNMTAQRNKAQYFRCYANYTHIQIVDKTDPTYPSGLVENTTVTITFPNALPVSVGFINSSGWLDLSFVNYTLPLMNGFESLNDYHITVNYLGVEVLDTDFDPASFSRYALYKTFAFKRFSCDVYLVEFHLYDAHSRALANISHVKLYHPTGATFTLPIPAGGSGSWKLPAGTGYNIYLRYKSEDWLTPLNATSFDVTSNIVISYEFPIYDVYVKITNFEKTWWVEGVNACFTWSYPTSWTQWGNMTSAVVSQSRRIEPTRYILLYQIPMGTHTLSMYVDDDYLWYKLPAGVSRALDRYTSKIGECVITVDSDDVYDNKVSSWIFDPKIVILTADGETLPDYVLAANTTLLVTVFNVTSSPTITYNTTAGHAYVQLYSNVTQRRVFVGGAKYNFTLYAGGVTVYGPTLALPSPPPSTSEIEVTTNIHKVTFVTKDYFGEFTIPNLKVTVHWAGINYTFFNETMTPTTGYQGLFFYWKDGRYIGGAVSNGIWLTKYNTINDTIAPYNATKMQLWPYIRNVESGYASWVSPATRVIMLFNETKVTDSNGNAVFYIPVWCYGKGANHTAVEFNVTTIPGTTANIPADLDSRSVIYRRYPAVLGSAGWLEYHASYPSGWFYNVSSSETVPLNVYAASFKIRVVDSNNNPLEGYYVNASIRPRSLTVIKSTHIVGQAVTDSDGWAYLTSTPGEDTIYWCNYSYVIWIYRVPAPDAVDQDGNPIVFDYYVVKALNYSFRYSYDTSSAISTDWSLTEHGGWDPWMWRTVKYAGTISVDLIDAYNEPLQDTLVVAKATRGAGTGQVIAYGFTDAAGKTDLLFPEEIVSATDVFYYYGYYNETDSTYRLESCQSVNLRVYWTKKTESYKVFWDVQIGAADLKSPDDHVTVQCSVFYAKLRFVSDTGRALEWAALEVPEGTDVGIPFKVTFYLEGQPREDVYVLEGFTLANATFNVNRCPIGDYRIEAWWPNYRDIKIYDTTISIDSNLPGPDVAEPVHDLKCLVYDITLNFKTPRGTVCDNAEATIVWPQGVTTVESSDANGNVELINVPTGTLTIQSLTWHGWDAITASIEKTIQATTTYYITADNIVTLNIKVVGARGQGLPYASVVIEDIATLTADESGVAWYELPRIPVTVRADYRGKTAEITVDLSELAATTYETTATVQLDVFIELFGYAMSASEFALAVILTIIIVLVVAFIIHEYIVWRRKRIAAAVVRA